MVQVYKGYASWILAASSTNFHFHIRSTMAFSKTIIINVAANFTGPSGNSIDIVMAFNKDAISPVPQNTAAAWKYVYSDCTINWITVLICDFDQGLYSLLW